MLTVFRSQTLFYPVLLVVILLSTFSCLKAQNVGAAFLMMNPDVRSAGMGEAGIAVGTDLSSILANPSKLPFMLNKAGAAISYSPWMPSLSKGVYVAYAGGFHKLNASNTLSSSIRFFSNGTFELSDNDFNSLGKYQPAECAFDVSYSRKFGESIGLATTLRYIYSGLASTNSAIAGVANSGKAFAMDVSFFQQHQTAIAGKDVVISSGLFISNLGTRLNYGQTLQKDFLPANIGIGASSLIKFDKHNTFTFALDLEKLMVPSTQENYSNESSLVSSLFTSFSDSPRGLSGELEEIKLSAGLEYVLNDAFAMRVGYRYESPVTGYRRYVSLGAGMLFKNWKIDMAYIAANPQANPMAGSLRVGVGFYIAGE